MRLKKHCMARGALPKSRQGFIYTIDAALAIFVLMLALSAALLLSSQGEVDPYGKMHLLLVSKDALAAMDSQGILQSGDKAQIEAALNRTLPGNIGAQLEINTSSLNGTFNQTGEAYYGGSAPGNATTSGARYDFVTMQNGQVANYSIVRMTVWQK